MRRWHRLLVARCDVDHIICHLVRSPVSIQVRTLDMNGVDVQRSLSSYEKHIVALHNDCQLYLSLTQDYLRASNEVEYKQLIALLETLKSARELTEATLQAVGKPDYVQRLYDTMDNFEKQEMLFPAMQADVNHIAASSTRSVQTKELLAAIRARILAIQRHRLRHNETLFAQIEWSASHITDYIKSILASSPPNALTLTMCKFCLQHASPQQRKQIIEYLEKAKDAALKVNVAYCHYSQPATMGFLVNNMIPDEPLTIQEIFEKFDAKWSSKISLEENLRKLSANVVIIDNRIGSPVYCQLKSLVDEDYILSNKLAISSAAGVTGTTVRKMATIVTLRDQANYSGEVGSPSVYKKNDGLPWLVLDRWGVDLYRIYRKNGILQDSSQIPTLLLGCPMRPLVYNECAWQTISGLHRPDMAVLRASFAARETAKFDADYIKGIALGQIETLVGGLTLPKKPEKIIKVVHSALSEPFVFDNIMFAVHDMYPAVGRQTDEDQLWNVVQFDIMSRLFYTELDREFSSAADRFLGDLMSADHISTAKHWAQVIVGIVMDRLDKYHVWTEYGVSFKKFVANH